MVIHSLEKILAQTHYYGKDFLIAELTNGFSIAYQKEQGQTIDQAFYGLVPIESSDPEYCWRVKLPIADASSFHNLYSGHVTTFTEDEEKCIKDYCTKVPPALAQLEQEEKEIIEKILRQSGIKTSWNPQLLDSSVQFGAATLLPLLLPFAPLYSLYGCGKALLGKEEWKQAFKDTLGIAAAGVLLPFVGVSKGITALASRTIRVTHPELLSTTPLKGAARLTFECLECDDVAAFFGATTSPLQDSKIVFIYFEGGRGYMKTTSELKRETPVWALGSSSITCSYSGTNYHQYYLPIDSALLQHIQNNWSNQLQIYQAWKSFSDSLTKKDHETLLQHIGW